MTITIFLQALVCPLKELFQMSTNYESVHANKFRAGENKTKYLYLAGILFSYVIREKECHVII